MQMTIYFDPIFVCIFPIIRGIDALRARWRAANCFLLYYSLLRVFEYDIIGADAFG